MGKTNPSPAVKANSLDMSAAIARYLTLFSDLCGADQISSLQAVTSSKGVKRGACITVKTDEHAIHASQVSLESILEDDPDERYDLSPRECYGILMRAERRGKPLPEQLRLALINGSKGLYQNDGELSA